MTDELIEQVFARMAHGDVKHRAWLKAELRNTFAELVQPHIEAQREDAARMALEAAATVAPTKTAADECETVGQWTRRTLREAIRAIDPAQFRRPA